MNILFLTPQLPYPPRQGSALRNYYLLRGLAETGLTIDLLSFAAPEQIAAIADNPLSQHCRNVRLIPLPPPRTISQRLRTLLAGKADMSARLASPAFAERLRVMLAVGDYDYMQVEGVEMSPYALAAKHPFYFDAHNAEYVIQQRAAATDLRQSRKLPKAIYSSVQARRLRSLERTILRRAARVLAVSEVDATALASLDPQQRGKIIVIPNGVDTSEYAPAVDPTPPLPDWGAQSVVFTGVLDYRPNVDALVWFCRQVWPAVLAAEATARFYIVGARAGAQVRELASLPGVVLVGEVVAVQPYIAAARVYVVPMLVGGGSRLKLLQALAMGKCIVSTTLGAEGIAVTPGHDVAIADDATTFARTLLHLLATPNHDLAVAARQLATRYDWAAILPRLVSLYR